MLSSASPLFDHEIRPFDLFPIGIDLYKKSITVRLVDQQGQILARRQLACQQPERIVAFFRQRTPFQAVMEAAASYESLWQPLEPVALGSCRTPRQEQLGTLSARMSRAAASRPLKQGWHRLPARVRTRQ